MFLKETLPGQLVRHCSSVYFHNCPGFGWAKVNFPPSSCCGLDLVLEEC